MAARASKNGVKKTRPYLTLVQTSPTSPTFTKSEKPTTPLPPETLAPIEPLQSSQALYPLAVGLTDAAAMVGLHRSYMWTLVRAGKIPHVRAGKRILIIVDDLRAWLVSQRVLQAS